MGPVAHVRKDGCCESVSTHLHEVADMAEHFADETGLVGLGAYARAAGAYHDLGKYSDAFQERILRNGPKVDHSTAGAYELFSKGNWPLSYCIAGHHGGLPDGGVQGDIESTLVGRLNKAVGGHLPSYEAWNSDSSLSDLLQLDTTTPILFAQDNPHGAKPSELQYFSIAFIIRMIFSCLVDADYLCTERFMADSARSHPSKESMNVLLGRLEGKLKGFYPPKGKLNRIRCGVLDDCRNRAKDAPGVFTLTVPTGGGKTLSVMRFALGHAVEHDMRRVMEEAQSLGVNVSRLRIVVIVLATFVTATTVSLCGIVGWIGLVIPHVGRMLVGTDHRSLVPATLLLGGSYLLVIDCIARAATATAIPLSILTAIIGAPFFVWMLRKTGGTS